MKSKMFVLLLVALSIYPKSLIAGDNRVKIAVIDTGIPTEKDLKPLLCTDNDFTINDKDGHATVIARIFKDEGLDHTKYCLYFRGVLLDQRKMYDLDNLFNEISNLIYKGVKYVNLSFAGAGFYKQEFQSYELLIRKGIKIYVAAGNNARDLDQRCDIYPACYIIVSDNWFVIGAKDEHNRRLPFSNYGWFVRYENGVKCHNFRCSYGTSFAVPRAIIKDIKKDSKI